MNASVRVVARLVAKSDQIEPFKSALLAAIEPTRQETGCLRYELLQNRADPTDFTFVEEWASEAALEAHLKAPHLAVLRGAIANLVAAAPDIRRYTTLR